MEEGQTFRGGRLEVMMSGSKLNTISVTSATLLFFATLNFGCGNGESSILHLPNTQEIERVEIDIGDPVGVLEITDRATIKNLVLDMRTAFQVGVNDSARSAPRISPGRKCIFFTDSSIEEFSVAPILIRSPSGIVIRNQVVIERNGVRGLLKSASLNDAIRTSLDESR